jgi:hypothetical protein
MRRCAFLRIMHTSQLEKPRSDGAERPSRKPIPLSQRAALSPAEFAALCGRSPTWAYRQIYAGRIKPISGCGRMLIPRDELTAFLARKAEYNPAEGSVR